VVEQQARGRTIPQCDEAAKHVTLARMANGQVNGAAMAYFFGVLAGAILRCEWRQRRPRERLDAI